MVLRGKVHDSKTSHRMVDSVRNFSYILADSAYDTSSITHSIPIIDTNKRGGIVQERLSVNRRIGIELRREYSSLYSLRSEIDHTLPILEGIMNTQIWYMKNKDYDTVIGLKVIAQPHDRIKHKNWKQTERDNEDHHLLK